VSAINRRVEPGRPRLAATPAAPAPHRGCSAATERTLLQRDDVSRRGWRLGAAGSRGVAGGACAMTAGLGAAGGLRCFWHSSAITFPSVIGELHTLAEERALLADREVAQLAEFGPLIILEREVAGDIAGLEVVTVATVFLMSLPILTVSGLGAAWLECGRSQRAQQDARVWLHASSNAARAWSCLTVGKTARKSARDWPSSR